MAYGTVTTSPYATTNAAGQFYTQSDGFIQGMAIADPVARFNLASGVYDSSALTPLWGGVAITENIPPSTGDGSLGGTIDWATTISDTGAAGALTGFAVSDQAYNWITTPQSNAPSASPGMGVGFYRLKSGARIILACAPSLVNLDGSPISQQVSWDFLGQRLVPYVAAYPAATPSVYNSYTSSTGILQLTFASAPGPLATDAVVLTGFTGAQAVFNGTWLVSSTASAGTVLNIQVTTGLGTISLAAAAGTLVAGGGAVPGRVLQTQASGNKTIVYNSATGTVNYVNSGAVAVLLLN